MPSRKEAQIRHAIQDFIRNAQLETGRSVVVTSKARQLIKTTLLAVVDDPSPEWNANPYQLRYTQEEMIRKLPSLLREIASSDDRRGTFPLRIDTFLFLHAISRLLDQICPFEKVGRTPRSV